MFVCIVCFIRNLTFYFNDEGHVKKKRMLMFHKYFVVFYKNETFED